MGSELGVKILGAWASPYVARARIALNTKGVEYVFQEEEVLLSKSETLIKYNPIYKKIPVLVHGDRPICESLIIIEYIDEVWTSGPSILPSDPYDRAMARFWTAYIDDKLFPALKQIIGAEDDEVSKAPAVEAANQVLTALEDAFPKCSKGGRFFGGDSVGCLDITLGCFTTWFKVISKMCHVDLIDESRTPNLFKWVEDFRADDAVKDVMPETDRLLEFAKFFLAMMKQAAAVAAAGTK